MAYNNIDEHRILDKFLNILLEVMLSIQQRYFRISDKLHEYIQKVQKETGRSVNFNFVQRPIGPGISAAFIETQEDITVLLQEGIQVSQLENSIAHEITHGLLRYAKGYPSSFKRRELDARETRTAEIIGTMIEDIPVNQIIQLEGFEPFAPNYVHQVRLETQAATKGISYYSEFDDPLLKFRFMVNRYITAWAYLKFFNLSQSSKIELTRFERAFRYHYQKQYKEASKIVDLICQNNIFEATGCRSVEEAILNQWGLSDAVSID